MPYFKQFVNLFVRNCSAATKRNSLRIGFGTRPPLRMFRFESNRASLIINVLRTN